VVVANMIPPEVVEAVKGRVDGLFSGQFDTGHYPDEWHWREGISMPHVTKEICNGWKSDSHVAAVVLSERIGCFVSSLLGWPGTRVGQDDVFHKPPGGSAVSYHQDGTYISVNFLPVENNAVTVWIALDDADAETGVVEYARGSHRWPRSSAKTTFHAGGAGYRQAMLDAAGTEKVDIAELRVPKGSCVIHHQDVWHGSACNGSKIRPRRAVALHLIREDVKFGPSPGYIYGRYKLADSDEPRPEFFPITYSTRSTTSARLFKIAQLPGLALDARSRL